MTGSNTEKFNYFEDYYQHKVTDVLSISKTFFTEFFFSVNYSSIISLCVTGGTNRRRRVWKKFLIDFSLRLLFSLKPKEMAKMRLFAIIMDRLEVKL